MDASVFDRLTQSVAGRSRRSALRTALAGATVAAGLLAHATGSGAKKKKRKKCKKCRGKAQGAECTTNKECCANETRLACALTSAAGGPVCCGVLGAPCSVDSDCCLGFECFASDRCVFEM